jgi:Xaa-Pro aminopeptidase
VGFAQRLSSDFYREVHSDVRGRLAAQGFVAGIFDDPDDVAYLTGFFHFPNERPVAVWLPVDDGADVVLLVPELEREYAEYQGALARIVSYPEFPGVRSPYAILAGDVPSPTGRVGHSGATPTARLELLRDAFGSVEFGICRAVDEARLLKRPEEIALHEEAGRITDHMLAAGRELVEDALRTGKPLPAEAELAGYVASAGSALMYAEHDDVVVVPHLAGGLVYSGANSARPHALPSGRRLHHGEAFMLSLGAGVGGRHVEGERTFILGEPTADQERYYSTILKAQQTGLAGLRSGRRCNEVNAECLAVIREAGLAHFLRHRQGHGIGLNIHEPPWLEDGDDTVLQTSMIVSDEPGLYVPGHAGYRISDSVLVTESGGQPLTFYPKELDDIVVAA